MKQSKKFTELTLQELQIQKNKIKGALIGLGIVMLLACISMIYLAVEKGNYGLIAVAGGCSITFLPIIIIYNQIKTEIKSRNSK